MENSTQRTMLFPIQILELGVFEVADYEVFAEIWKFKMTDPSRVPTLYSRL